MALQNPKILKGPSARPDALTSRGPVLAQASVPARGAVLPLYGSSASELAGAVAIFRYGSVRALV